MVALMNASGGQYLNISGNWNALAPKSHFFGVRPPREQQATSWAASCSSRQWRYGKTSRWASSGCFEISVKQLSDAIGVRFPAVLLLDSVEKNLAQRRAPPHDGDTADSSDKASMPYSMLSQCESHTWTGFRIPQGRVAPSFCSGDVTCRAS